MLASTKPSGEGVVMTVARSTIVSLETTLWFLITVRAVRRSWLCGKDPVTGQDFGHRRGWIRERIKQLSSIFAIDVASYAILSNHYHAVVLVDRDRALQWTVDEVLQRWTQLFRGPTLVRRYLSEYRAIMTEAEVAEVEVLAEMYRSRLYDLSWFMRTLNEFIARKANAEDRATGRFWEGRFKSQALLDEAALLAAMAYVDLNPVRAGIAETPEASAYTAIQERIQALAGQAQGGGSEGNLRRRTPK